jgi:hypothetical protein
MKLLLLVLLLLLLLVVLLVVTVVSAHLCPLLQAAYVTAITIDVIAAATAVASLYHLISEKITVVLRISV